MQSMNSKHIHLLGASFSVIGPDVELQELTDRFGITPTFSFRKGDPKPSGEGSFRGTYPETLWSIESPSLPENPYIDSHILYILNVIEPHADYVIALSYRAELFVELQCALDDRFLSTSFVVNRDLLSRLARLKVELGFAMRVSKNECR